MSISFNREQLNVINELERNIFLVAPAGTGKTNTLAYRIANILKRKIVRPEEILCITFTTKACKEMQERIQKNIKKEWNKITIKTFHGFCLQLLKEEAKRNTDIFTDFIIYDEEDCKEVLKHINYFGYPIKNLENFINTVKEYRIRYGIMGEDPVKDYKEVIDKLYSDDRSKIEEICKINFNLNLAMLKDFKEKGNILIEGYNRILENNHALDFNDLILKTSILMKEKEVVERLKNRYKYINIDEMQDTSLSEYRIIEKLFGQNNILLSGDKFQTIYTWRGSSPLQIIKEFRNKYNPIEIVLNKNYRGTKILTDASKEFLGNCFRSDVMKTYSDGVEAENDILGDKILLSKREDIRDEAKFILEEIDELNSNGADLSKICVLTRNNSYNIQLSKELNREYDNRGYEFILVDEYKFFRRQEIKDVIAFLKIIINKNDSISLERILKRLNTGIGQNTLDEIKSKEYRKCGIKLTDFIDYNTIEYGEYFRHLIDNWEKDNIIIFDVESTGVDVTEDEIIQIAAIRVNKSGEILERFERFIKPNKSVGLSESVHGFSDEKLKEIGEPKDIVFNDFIEFSKGRIVVGHNVQYDISILNSELMREGLPNAEFLGVYDTLDIYRRFYPNLKNHKLENLSNLFKTNHKPSHDAMDDIIATSELLIKSINEKIKNTSQERIAYMGKYLKSFRDISNKLNKLIKDADKKRPEDIIIDVLRRFDLLSRYKNEERSEREERIINFYYLAKELDDYVKSNRDALIDIVNLTALSNGEIEEIMVNRTGKIRIPIITVHQAKGLEFDYVFLCGLYQTGFPNFFAVKENRLSEEARLFYVAITRAKKRLYLSYPKVVKDRNKIISNFITRIPEKYIEIREQK